MSDMHHQAHTPSSFGSPPEHHHHSTSHHHHSQDAEVPSDGDMVGLSGGDGKFPGYGVDQRRGHSRQQVQGSTAKSLQIVFLVIFVILFLTVLAFIIAGAHTDLHDSGYGLAPNGAGTLTSFTA